jgi:outer membrane immunogenic protein
MWMAGACVLAAVGLDLALGSGQALAADLPVPPVQPPAGYFPATPPTDWAGFYVGLNGGYDVGTSNWTGTGVSTGGFKTSGGMGGGTVGLNLQTGSVVLGFEGDADWTDINGSRGNAYCSSVTVGATCVTKNSVLATARARVGYAFDRVLVYATGGGAFGNVLSGLSPPTTFDDTVSFGWTGGAGIEVAFAERWTAKVEYLYLDLDHTPCISSNCGPTVSSNTPVGVSFTQNIVRAGVNFRFAPW